MVPFSWQLKHKPCFSVINPIPDLFINSKALPALLSPTNKFLIWYSLPQELAFSPYNPGGIVLKFCLLQSKDISFKGFALFNKAFNYMPNFHHFLKSAWSQQVEMSLSTHLKKSWVWESVLCWTKSSVSLITWWSIFCIRQELTAQWFKVTGF